MLAIFVITIVRKELFEIILTTQQLLEDYLRYKNIRKDRNPRKPKIINTQEIQDPRQAARIQFTPRPDCDRVTTAEDQPIW